MTDIIIAVFLSGVFLGYYMCKKDTRLHYLKWYYSRDFVKRKIADENYRGDDW